VLVGEAEALAEVAVVLEGDPEDLVVEDGALLAEVLPLPPLEL
jgi:hypothetical protein